MKLLQDLRVKLSRSDISNFPTSGVKPVTVLSISLATSITSLSLTITDDDDTINVDVVVVVL